MFGTERSTLKLSKAIANIAPLCTSPSNSRDARQKISEPHWRWLVLDTNVAVWRELACLQIIHGDICARVFNSLPSQRHGVANALPSDEGAVGEHTPHLLRPRIARRGIEQVS